MERKDNLTNIFNPVLKFSYLFNIDDKNEKKTFINNVYVSF